MLIEKFKSVSPIFPHLTMLLCSCREHFHFLICSFNLWLNKTTRWNSCAANRMWPFPFSFFISYFFKTVVQKYFSKLCKSHKKSTVIEFSNNINEVIRAILNLFIFFLQEDITHTKSTKSIKIVKSTKTVKNVKNVKSTKRQTSGFLPLRCFLCA